MATLLFEVDFLAQSGSAGGIAVDIDTLVGTDADSANGWWTTSYAPGLLHAGGYGGQLARDSPDEAIAFIDGPRTELTAGATYRIQFGSSPGADGATSYALLLLSSDGGNGIEIQVSGSIFVATAWQGSYYAEHPISLVNGSNAIALTLTPTRAEIALNGTVYDIAALTPSEWPGFHVAMIDMEGKRPIQKLQVFDALPDETGLAELSDPAWPDEGGGVVLTSTVFSSGIFGSVVR